MDLIQVDQEKCIRCGLCADVCPMNVINMGSGTTDYMTALYCLRALCGCLSSCRIG